MPMMPGEQYRASLVGGGMHHQRMATLDSYDLEPVKTRAREAAGIG